MKLFWRIVAGVAVVAVLGYGALVAYIYFNQRSLQYDTSGRMFDLSETQLQRAQVVKIPSADQSELTGWYDPPQAGKPLIIYFRGNVQSFSREFARFEAFEKDGYGFLSFDYRGFPGSPGQLTMEHALQDSLAAFDWVKAKGFPIVLWGRSLGSGPGTYVASERQADALFLETPFDSAAAVARDRYPWLPVDLLTIDRYPVDQWILKVDEPVFVTHGTNDHTIADYHGRRVYDLAPHKAGIWIVPGADHDQLWAAGEWDKARAFFEDAEKAAGH